MCFRTITLLTAIMCGALAACARPEEDEAKIRAWLLCEECDAGERQAVVDIDVRAVPYLVKALKGPPPERREAVRQQLEDRYDALAVYASSNPAGAPPLTLTRSEYVSQYLSNYEAVYQSRAAIALGRIGTEAAKNALEELLSWDSAGVMSLRPDVRLEVAAALQFARDSVHRR